MKKTILACFFILILMGSILAFANFSTLTRATIGNFLTISYAPEKKENGNYEVDSFFSLPEKELTLLEAFNLGLEQGKKFDKETILVFMNSVDDETVSGRNGKKGDWQGVFALPTVKHRMIFAIEKGKLKSYSIIDSSDELTIPQSEIKIDSSQIVKIAVEKFNLQPSPIEDPFSHGYHYRLIRDEQNIFLGVDGKINGESAEIFFNPKNGEYLGSINTKEN